MSYGDTCSFLSHSYSDYPHTSFKNSQESRDSVYFLDTWVVQLKLILSAEVQSKTHFMQLLSPGVNERTLTALAIVIAVFLSNTQGERRSDGISRKPAHFETRGLG